MLTVFSTSAVAVELLSDPVKVGERSKSFRNGRWRVLVDVHFIRGVTRDVISCRRRVIIRVYNQELAILRHRATEILKTKVYVGIQQYENYGAGCGGCRLTDRVRLPSPVQIGLYAPKLLRIQLRVEP
jgi:hypothetical protein